MPKRRSKGGSSKAASARATFADKNTAVAHQMIREDVEWLYSVALAAQGSPIDWAVGLAAGTQMARVTYEGYEYVRKRYPDRIPQMGEDMLTNVAIARHAIKLVDDTERSLEDVMAVFESTGQRQTRAFGRELDCSVVYVDDYALATGRLAEYQALAFADATASRELAHAMGESMVSILYFGIGQGFPQPTTLVVPVLSVQQKTMSSSDFYPSIYTSKLTPSQKDLLLAAECAVQAALLFETMSGRRFASSVFRAQLVAFTHASSAIRAIAEIAPKGALPLQHVLGQHNFEWLLNQTSLRNRSMHYGVPPGLAGIDGGLPMYGLVEAIAKRPYEDVKEILLIGLRDLAEGLMSWRVQVSVD